MSLAFFDTFVTGFQTQKGFDLLLQPCILEVLPCAHVFLLGLLPGVSNSDECVVCCILHAALGILTCL